jgi:iron complex outermembrane receptor protein
LLLLSSPARAEEPDELNPEKIDWLEEFSLEELFNMQVTSATRTQVRLSEAPARIIVITREQIRRHAYRYLRDVFRDLPGYQVGYWSTSEWGTSLAVRGLTGNHRLVFLLDGQRLNPPGGEEVPLFANYPLTFVDHIEVMYGPGSALYGNDAFNGIVNIVTTPGNPRDGVIVNGSAGSYGATDVSTLGRKAFGPAEVRIGLHYTRSDQPNVYRLYPGEYSYGAAGTPPTRLDAVPSPTHDLRRFEAGESGYDALVFAGTKDTHATFQLRGYDQSSSWDHNASGAPFVSQARFADQQYLASLSHEFEVGKLRSTTTADYSHYQVLPRTRFVSPVNLRDRTFSESSRRGLSYAVRFEEKVDLTFVPDTLTLTAGLAGQHVDVTPISLSGVGDIAYRRYIGPGDSPQVDENGFVRDLNTSLFTAPSTIAASSRVRFQTLGAYGQLLWNPSSLFHLTAGVRFDYSTRFGVSINPRLAVVSAPFESTSLKLLYGSAYLEPTPYQVYGVLTDPDSLVFPNPNLKPERLDSIELVWEQRAGKNLRISTGGFVNRVVDNINDTAWTGGYVYVPVVQLQRRRELQSANAGESVYYGSETQAQLTTGIVQSSLSLSLIDGTTRTLNLRGVLTEGHPQNVSSATVKGGVSVEPIKDVILDLRGTYQTAPNLRFIQSDYPLAAAAAPSLVIDAAVRYSLGGLWTSMPFRTLDVFIDGRNLTDRRYKQPSGRPAVNPTGSPQPPLQIMAGVEFEI